MLRYGFAPLFAASFGAAAAATVWSGGPLWALPLLLVLAITVGLAAERLLPYEQTWNSSQGDTGRDLGHAFVNEGLSGLTVASIPLISGALGLPSLWPTNWPGVAQLFLAIIIADFGITLAHFASHRVERLWRLHAVHHSVGRLYGLNGLMKHPLHQLLETLAGSIPLLLLGLPLPLGALLAFCVAIQLLLQHSNVDIRLGFVAKIWAVAPVHRHHHRSDAVRGDVNFGLFTCIWDRLLGTAFEGGMTPRSGEVGIDGRPNYPAGYGAQLLEPFR